MYKHVHVHVHVHVPNLRITSYQECWDMYQDLCHCDLTVFIQVLKSSSKLEILLLFKSTNMTKGSGHYMYWQLLK